jgi:DnaJ-class molecular chaperone
MPAKRDYYETLGVGKHASQDEIRKSHRKLVRQYHPDANPNNPSAAEKFKEVQEAYDVLSDTEKRKQYDTLGHAAFDPHMGAGQPGPGAAYDPYEAFRRAGGNRNYRTWKGSPNVTVEDFDFGAGGEGGGGFADIFEQLFRGGSQGRRNRQAAAQAEQPVPNIEQSITISFQDAARGCTIPIRLERGGKVETLDLKIPAGVKNGSRVRVRGKGQIGPNGQSGDLYIITKITDHPYFRREDLDIYLDLPISMYEAILGTRVEVPTLDGPVTLTVPPNTSSGAKLRIRGRGIHRGDDQGDQFVVTKIIVPKEEDRELREQMERFAKRHPINARKDVRWAQKV